MSSWAKGALAEALEATTQQRKARHTLVNAAFDYNSEVLARQINILAVGGRGESYWLAVLGSYVDHHHEFAVDRINAELV